MRLIDADALKMEFPKDEDWDYPVNTNSFVCELIDKQPTIEPERKKGKWLNEYEMKCSICGFECDDPYYLGEANFCPNCGADMRGDPG